MDKKFLPLFFLVLLFFVGCSFLPVSSEKDNAATGETIVPQQQEELKVISLNREEKIGLINDIHRYSVINLGLKPTVNCSALKEDCEGYLYEFGAPELEIPYSYEDRYSEDSWVDRYSYQTAAAAAWKYGPALLNETADRIIFVVFHEIWHDQVKYEISWEEAIGTVVGYAAGLKYTEDKFGKNSNIYQDLRAGLDRYLSHSQINNGAWNLLNSLYGEYKSGNISKEDAIAEKKEILISAEENYKLLGIMAPYELNNASIGFTMTYTRHFPSVLEVYVQKCQENVLALIKIYKQ